MKDREVQTLFYYVLDFIAEKITDSRFYRFPIHKKVNNCATYLNLVLSSYRTTKSIFLMPIAKISLIL